MGHEFTKPGARHLRAHLVLPINAILGSSTHVGHEFTKPGARHLRAHLVLSGATRLGSFIIVVHPEVAGIHAFGPRGADAQGLIKAFIGSGFRLGFRT